MLLWHGELLVRVCLICIQVLHPLTDLLKGNAKHFTMTPEAEVSFTTLKQHLPNTTNLSHFSILTEA